MDPVGPPSIPVEISAFASSYPKLAEEYKQKQLAEETKKPLSNCIFKWLFNYHRMLVKDTLSFQDLPPLDREFTSQDIEIKVQTVIDDILKHKDKYQKKFSNVSNVYGLYDHIIQRIVQKKRRLAVCLWFGLGLATALDFQSLVITFENIPFPGSTRETHLWLLLLAIVLNTVAKLTKDIVVIYLNRLEESTKLLARQTLLQLVHEKLSLSDLYFLENADNNMIYKLLYLELDDYVRPVGCFGGILALLPITILLLVCSATQIQVTTMSRVFSILLFCRILLSISLSVFRRQMHTKYKAITFELRKTLYELIKNFKSFTLKNLKGRYRNIAEGLIHSKCHLLHKLVLISSFEVILYVIGLCLLLILPQLSLLGTIPTLFHVLPFLITYMRLDIPIRRLNTQVEETIHYKSAKQLYDKFFDNDFVVGIVKQQVPSLPKGVIIIQDCDLLERDPKSIIQTLNYIGHKEEETDVFPSHKKQDIMKKKTEASVKGKAKHHIPTQLSVPMKALQRSESLQPTGLELVSRLKIIFSGLRLNISPGSNLCILDSPNKTCIRGLLTLLLGEGFINKGQVITNGVVAHYSNSPSKFLVGKTIRDNIIFGREYNGERYAEVFRLLGIHFGVYRGNDFYEVAEQAVNMAHADRRLVLLARFLYQEADIYIIEGNFFDLCQNISPGAVKAVFQGWLKDKTVIFVSDKNEMIRYADTVIMFDPDNSYKIVPATEYLTQVGAIRTRKLSVVLGLPILDPLEARSQVLQTKLKNSVFLANMTFEEELRIHKLKEQRKEEIDQMRRKNTDVLEMISYGIYLTNKRRQEGKNLEDDCELKLSSLNAELKKFARRTIPTRHRIGLIAVYMLAPLSVLLFEAVALRYYSNGPVSSENNRDSFLQQMAPWISGLLLLNLVKQFLINYCGKYNFVTNNKYMLQKLLDASIVRMLRMRSHRVLDKLNREIKDIEVSLPKNLDAIFSDLACILSHLIALMYTYSLVIPLVVVGCHLLSMYWIFSLFVAPFTKLMKIHGEAGYKMDDFNFQVLSLVASYRPSNMLDKLTKKRVRLLDNSASVKAAIEFHLKFNIQRVSLILSLIWAPLYAGMFLLYLNVPAVNLWGVNQTLLIWSGVLLYRMHHLMYRLPYLLLTEAEDSILAVFRFNSFLSRLNGQTDKPPEYNPYKNRRPTSLTTTVVFKNVSLTNGFQPVLKKISFKVSKGEVVGVFGVDKGGKAALFDLITGVLSRDSMSDSQIIVFGRRIEDMCQDDEDKDREDDCHDITMAQIWKDVFYIERSPALIEGTVRENIDPTSEEADETLISLLIKASFEKVVKREDIESRRDIKFDPRFFVDKKKNIFELSEMVDKDSGYRAQTTHLFVPEGTREYPRGSEEFQEFKDMYLKRAAPDSDRPYSGRQKKTRMTEVINPTNRPLQENHERTQIETVDRANVHKSLGELLRPDVKNLLSLIEEREEDSKMISSPPLPQVIKPSSINSLENLNQQPGYLAEGGLLQLHESSKAEEVSMHSVKTVKKCEGMDVKEKDVDLKDFESSDTKKNLDRKRLANLKKVQSRQQRIDPSESAISQVFPSSINPSSVRDMKGEDYSSREVLIRPSRAHDHMGESSANNHSLEPEISPPIPPKLQEASGSPDSNESIENDNESDHSERKHKNGTFAKRSSIMWGKQRTPEEEAPLFLSKKTAFEGKNLDKQTRRLVVYCRAIITKPKLLLIFEESLGFGRGFSYNVGFLKEMLPETSIICVTKTSTNLLTFSNILFLDAGKILEKGSPVDLITNEQSYLHKYLKESDSSALETLLVTIEEKDMKENRCIYITDPPAHVSFNIEVIRADDPPGNSKINASENRQQEVRGVPTSSPVFSQVSMKRTSIETGQPTTVPGSHQAMQTHPLDSVVLESKVLHDTEEFDPATATERVICESTNRLLGTKRRYINPAFSRQGLMEERVRPERPFESLRNKGMGGHH